MKTKKQLEREIAQNRSKAEQWQNRIRKQLYDMLGVGKRHTLPGGNPMGRSDIGQQGGVGFVSGVAPNDIQVAEYIRQMGGNPYLKKARQLQEQQSVRQVMQRPSLRGKQVSPQITGATPGLVPLGPPPPSDYTLRDGSPPSQLDGVVQQLLTQQQNQLPAPVAGQPAENTQLQDFLAEAQAKYDEANAANEGRYGDILGRLEDSRERNLGRVENFGVAAGEDLEERAKETLGNIRANLSARGLGSSTIFDAFRQRNKRDLAREQQRLAEMVDSRTAQYDQNLTNNIAGFMERRNDVAPDAAYIANLAQQYGLSNEGQGFNAPQAEAAPVVQEGGGIRGPVLQQEQPAPAAAPQQRITYGGSSPAGQQTAKQRMQQERIDAEQAYEEQQAAVAAQAQAEAEAARAAASRTFYPRSAAAPRPLPPPIFLGNPFGGGLLSNSYDTSNQYMQQQVRQAQQQVHQNFPNQTIVAPWMQQAQQAQPETSSRATKAERDAAKKAHREEVRARNIAAQQQNAERKAAAAAVEQKVRNNDYIQQDVLRQLDTSLPPANVNVPLPGDVVKGAVVPQGFPLGDAGLPYQAPQGNQGGTGISSATLDQIIANYGRPNTAPPPPKLPPFQQWVDNNRMTLDDANQLSSFGAFMEGMRHSSLINGGVRNDAFWDKGISQIGPQRTGTVPQGTPRQTMYSQPHWEWGQ